MKGRHDRLIMSDEFLSKHHFFRHIDHIKKTGAKRITIIGGSHSGFSCAWMLLNGPATYKQLKSRNWEGGFPKMKIYQNQDCKVCESECVCLGSKFGAPCFEFDTETQLPKDLVIQILYRDRIRVFYNSVQQAIDDDYTIYHKEWFTKKTGLLYGFTGLRGDAKDLYLKIAKGNEPRVKLIKAETYKEQEQFVKESDFVIWACGYQSNRLHITDHKGKKI